MSLYCGIDLHSNNNYMAILNEKLIPVHQCRYNNEMPAVLEALEPFRDDLVGIAVESTPNWYWFVDGLTDTGYKMHLTNTFKSKQYDGLKYSDDRHDARWLARLLCLGILPEGYIYPRKDRPWRDLLRRRAFLVRSRTAQILSIKSLCAQYGMRARTSDVKRWTGNDVEELLGDPQVSLSVNALRCVAKVMTAQIVRIEKQVVGHAELREEFRLLRTARGIGEAIALTIMYEIGEISRFPKVGIFASYSRCVSSGRFSNGKLKDPGEKRNGNPYLSLAFTEAAHFANRFEPLAKRFYDRKRTQTNSIVAIRALANKMARGSYYVMRDQVPFEPKLALG